MGSGATACQAGSSLRPSTRISPSSRGSGHAESRDASVADGCCAAAEAAEVQRRSANALRG